MSDNTEWVKSWVEHYNDRDGNTFNQCRLTTKEVEKAAIIGNAAFRGNMGVGDAAKAGIEAVKKLRE